MSSLPKKLVSRIQESGQGWVFTPQSFTDLGESAKLSVALNRLNKHGVIRRLARGLYDYPARHKNFGLLFPSAETIAKTIAERDGIRLLPSGAYAANLLGLSEQVPSRLVFLTDGKPRKIQIEKLVIEFRRGSPRYMALAGTEAGLVIQALRHLGQNNVDSGVIGVLRKKLSQETKRELLAALGTAPAWMRITIRKVCEGEK